MFYMGVDEPRLPAPRDLVAASAGRLRAERVNPIWWQTRTWLGEWLTEDRLTWRTKDGHWLAQIQRSVNRRHVFMAVWHDGAYAGFQDDTGWHPATARSRKRAPHPVVRSLPLPLPLAG
jgi:hypothetical protein